MTDTINLAYELHDMLLNSKQYSILKEKEKNMECNEKLLCLFNLYKESQEKYAKNKTNDNLKEMSKIKYEIDTNELVVEYNKAYKEYMILVDEISSIAFKDLVSDNDIFKRIRATK